ncbi:MAG: hypothetical protein MRJ66_13920 [Nitrospira sp.]|nr:hypothetical protein [Nitrospira sp.]MDR4465357.1 hypothetical protein [Nitrospira sp.]
MKTLKDKAQFILFCALLIAALCMTIIAWTDGKWLGGLAAMGTIFGGVFLWPLSFVVYLVSLIVTIYRNTVHEFWADWCPLNFGLALGEFTITMTWEKEEDYYLTLLPAIGIGFVLAAILSQSRLLDSRSVLLFLGVLSIPALLGSFPAYRPYLLLHVFSIAAIFIILPIMRTVISGWSFKGRLTILA